MGTPLRIEGRVVDLEGRAISGVEVIAWQVDAGGNYNHPDEADSTRKTSCDPNFAHDVVLAGMSRRDRRALQADLEPLEAGDPGAQLARWRVVLR